MRIFALPCLAILLVATPVGADHYCSGPGVLLVDAGGAAYVSVDDLWGDPNRFEIRTYAETNGITGLQRGGSSLLWGDLDPCQNSLEPDLYVS